LLAVAYKEGNVMPGMKPRGGGWWDMMMVNDRCSANVWAFNDHTTYRKDTLCHVNIVIGVFLYLSIRDCPF
jgi:hypothetical protein